MGMSLLPCDTQWTHMPTVPRSWEGDWTDLRYTRLRLWRTRQQPQALARHSPKVGVPPGQWQEDSEHPSPWGDQMQQTSLGGGPP